ncbi:DUF6349 family protein [Nonomuraea sp. NPDC001636]|uniref:DUF6349 family protein n=1 Tax=Nonomuraea sp. NPDC001636 TaxID=3154391 RepID=UPI003328F016
MTDHDHEPRGAVARHLHYRSLTHRPTGVWAIYITHPGNVLGQAHAPLIRAEEHLPTVLFQSGVSPRRFLGACLGCTWESEREFGHVLLAVEAAHDHTHPGWRALPAVHPRPKSGPAKQWIRQVTAAYPAGWFARGGPILTIRADRADRMPLPHRAPGGRGYDLPALPPAHASVPATPAPSPTASPLIPALEGRTPHARLHAA